MTDLNARNTASFEQTMKLLVIASGELTAQIDGLRATVTTLTGRVQELERTILLMRAASAGHGPTER